MSCHSSVLSILCRVDLLSAVDLVSKYTLRYTHSSNCRVVLMSCHSSVLSILCRVDLLSAVDLVSADLMSKTQYLARNAIFRCIILKYHCGLKKVP